VEIGVSSTGDGKNKRELEVRREEYGEGIKREKYGNRGGGGKKVRWEEGDGIGDTAGDEGEASEQLWREMREGWRWV